MSKNTSFWNKVASSYAKSTIKDTHSYNRKLKETQKYLRKDMYLLEVGCGTGMTAVKHAPFVKHIHAIDISPAMIEISKERATEQNINNIRFEINDICSLDVEDKTYDVILAMSIIHLLPNPQLVLKTLYEKLKPGGILVSSTICLGDKMNYFKGIIAFMRLFHYAPDVVHFFKKNELLKLFKDQGFKIENEWQPSERKAVFIVARK